MIALKVLWGADLLYTAVGLMRCEILRNHFSTGTVPVVGPATPEILNMPSVKNSLFGDSTQLNSTQFYCYTLAAEQLNSWIAEYSSIA